MYNQDQFPKDPPEASDTTLRQKVYWNAVRLVRIPKIGSTAHSDTFSNCIVAESNRFVKRSQHDTPPFSSTAFATVV